MGRIHDIAVAVNRQIKRANYDYELFAREHTVCGKRFRSHDPVIQTEPLMNELVQRCSSGDVVYDIGAHTGRYSLLAASIGAEVYAFEPNPHAYSRLAANVSVNEFESIDIRNIGLGDREAEETFYISSKEPRSSFDRTSPERGSAEIVDTAQISLTAIDNLSDEIPSPDHLKINVEGLGVSVLNGGEKTVRKSRPEIYFEPHGNDVEAREWFEQHSYDINKLGYPWMCSPESSGSHD
jgi:FkbM family methyltransferase